MSELDAIYQAITDHVPEVRFVTQFEPNTPFNQLNRAVIVVNASGKETTVRGITPRDMFLLKKHVMLSWYHIANHSKDEHIAEWVYRYDVGRYVVIRDATDDFVPF